MARITVIHDQLGQQITEYEYNGLLIDWLVQEFPDGFGAPIIITVNGRHVPIEDSDYFVNECDDVQIEVRSMGTGFEAALFNFVVATIISYTVGKLTEPKKPRKPAYAEAPEENPVYSLRVKNNPLPGYGEVIPVVYGDVLLVPPYASHPYITYTHSVMPNAPPSNASISVKVNFPQKPSLNESYSVPSSNIWFHPYGLIWDNATENFVRKWWPAVQLENFLDYYINWSPAIVGYIDKFRLSPSETNPFAPGASPSTDYSTNGEAGTVHVELIGTRQDIEVGLNSIAGESFFNALFVIGQGNHEVITPADIMIGDTPLTAFDPKYYTMLDCPVTLHLQQMEYISYFFWLEAQNNPAQNVTSNFHENVWSSGDIGGQDLENIGSTLYFPVANMKVVDRIEVDIGFQRGLYSINSTTGAFRDISVRVDIQMQTYSALTGWSAGVSTLYTVVFRNNAQRTVSPFIRTIVMNVGPGIYRLRLTRQSAKPVQDGSVSDVLTWLGLRGYALQYDPSSREHLPAYGNTHLLALRLRASDTISNAGQGYIRVRARRKIYIPPEFSGQPNYFAFTRNPAAIAADILTNINYGGRRPHSEVDFERFVPLYDKWKTANGFNAVFNDRVTLFEALEVSLQPVLAYPLILGSLLSVRWEHEQAFYYQLFTEQNILRDSYSVSYSFDAVGSPDGYEVKYANYDTWQEVSVKYPDTAVRPQQVSLFGCSDEGTANSMAVFLYNRNKWARKTCRFGVELEGMIPLPGDLVAVQHSLVEYSSSGVVVAFDPATLQMKLDRKVVFETGKSYGMRLRAQHGHAIGSPGGGLYPFVPYRYTVTRIADDIVQLDSLPIEPIITFLEDNPTHWVFGEIGLIIDEYLVDSIEPNGDDTFTINCTFYDPRLYSGTFSFLQPDDSDDYPRLP